jgi:acyl-CoA thioester hydrolase
MIEARHLFQVMTYDIDFAGVLNNGVYIRWLEDLRALFAEQVLPLAAAFKRGIVPTLSRTEIDYLAPVRFPDKLEGRMGLFEHGRARFVLWGEFTSQASGLITARAKQTGVFVDLTELRPAPLPAEFKALGSAHQPRSVDTPKS